MCVNMNEEGKQVCDDFYELYEWNESLFSESVNRL